MPDPHPPVRTDDDVPLGPPLGAEAFRPEEATATALAAIMTRYEDARARIIAAPSLPAAADDAGAAAGVVPPRWAPTVPVDLGSGLPCPPRDRTIRPGRAAVAAAGEPPRRQHGRLRALLSRIVRAGAP